MISLMNKYLDGCPALQRMILMYCLDTPTAKIIQEVIQNIDTKRIDRNSLWCLMGPIKKSHTLMNCITNTRHCYSTFIVFRELELARVTDPIFGGAFQHQFKEAKKTEFRLLYNDLMSREIHGTPSGIRMRRHFENLKSGGIELREHETVWSRFVCLRGRVAEKPGHPKLVLTPEVSYDFHKIYDYYHEKVMEERRGRCREETHRGCRRQRLPAHR